jgi:hypothetical protein
MRPVKAKEKMMPAHKAVFDGTLFVSSRLTVVVIINFPRLFYEG